MKRQWEMRIDLGAFGNHEAVAVGEIDPKREYVRARITNLKVYLFGRWQDVSIENLPKWSLEQLTTRFEEEYLRDFEASREGERIDTLYDGWKEGD